MDMTPENLITVPCRTLKTLPDETKHQIARIVAEYYQEKGFPFFDLSLDERQKIFSKLKNFCVDTLELPDNVLQQNMLGLNLANYYHPQMWSARYKNSRTPMEVFQDTDLLTKALYKRINLSDTKLQPFNIRKSIKVFGAYGISNFRPTIAKYIYEKYCPNGGTVLDPCAGYGGRLLGALTSSTVSVYVGIDPEYPQIRGNRIMSNDFSHPDKVVAFGNLPFEDVELDRIFDLVFTSPPYFNVEKYSDDENQSYMRYPTYDEWKNNFLHVLIEKSFDLLLPGGHFIINVAGANIVEDTLIHAKKIFGELKETKHMRLSRVLGNGNTGNFKLEDIFIFQK